MTRAPSAAHGLPSSHSPLPTGTYDKEIEALKEEIKIHRKLKHRHVVELLGEFRRPEKDKWYIVLELVPGTSLQDLADEGREALSGAVFESSLNRL